MPGAGLATLQMLMGIARSWGDTVVMRYQQSALGNAALNAAGTPEQKERWGKTMLAMAITEPGCGSDSKAIKTTAKREGDHWVLDGEKIFVTTGIRAEGVVVWATIDASAGRAGIKVVRGDEGHAGLRDHAQGKEARHSLERHCGALVHELQDPARSPARRRRDRSQARLRRVFAA
jgi:acyl-CoA dehydrogenase